jgi:hypothetical protein
MRAALLALSVALPWRRVGHVNLRDELIIKGDYLASHTYQNFAQALTRGRRIRIARSWNRVASRCESAGEAGTASR